MATNTAAMMPILEVQGLSKNYSGVTALSEVSLNLEQGEVLGLIGANGAGKTTLFSVISGFYPPSLGRVIFKGQDITGKKPYEVCRRGMVRTFQVVRPFRNMTVKMNVMVGKLFGRDRVTRIKEAEKEALDVLHLVGLEEKAEVPAGELGLADHKRLELARALNTNPEVLLLDEVLAGLTPTEVAQAVEIIKKINRQRKVSIFLVEHVLKAVFSLCQRIVVLHYGRKIAEGGPEEIADNQEVIEAYLGEKHEL